MKTMVLAAFAASALAASTLAASATTYTFTADEFNGTGAIGAALVKNWSIAIGAGETIVSAVFKSNFGTMAVPSSATGFVTVGGNTVGTCAGPGNSCWDGPGAPISYTFGSGQFASLLGSVDLIYDQTDCCVIRLGASTLTIDTARVSSVPLPAAFWLLLSGLTVAGAGTLVRRKPALGMSF
jgi:hypothetical protein